jgi:hypothetical protein
VLPSHLDHPQWNYHWRGFTEARHKHLSAQLGMATASEPPPRPFSPVDQAWWRLDGLKKAHEHMRVELLSAREHRVQLLEDEVARIVEEAALQRKEINARFMGEFPDLGAARPFNDYLQSGLAGPASKGAEYHVLQKYKHEFDRTQNSMNDRVSRLKNMLHAVRLDYDRDVQARDSDFEAKRLPLEREYERLLGKRVASAAIPQVRTAQTTEGAVPLIGSLRVSLAKAWGDLLLAAYREPLQHIHALVASAAAGGARNVLIVADSTSILQLVVGRIPASRALVTSTEAKSGNLRWAFEHETKFDLCVWDLDLSDLSGFTELAEMIRPLMNPGATVAGFHWNLTRAAVPIEISRKEDIDCMRTYTAMAPRYIHVSERLRRVVATRGRLHVIRSLPAYLFRVLPRIPLAPRNQGSPAIEPIPLMEAASWSTIMIEIELAKSAAETRSA